MSIRVVAKDDVLHVEWLGAASDDELRAYFDELTTLVDGRAPYAMVYDLRRASPPSSNQRRQLAQLTARDGPGLRARCVGIAFVIESALVRAALSGMLWIQPIETDHTVLASMAEAERWAAAKLGARGVEARP